LKPNLIKEEIMTTAPSQTHLIGQKLTPSMRATLVAEHPHVRFIGPTTAVTMDYIPDRLNVYIDSSDIIIDVKLG
jgi:hypothetical protein